MRYRTLTALAALIVLLGTAGPALAGGDWGHNRRYDGWHHRDDRRHHHSHSSYHDQSYYDRDYHYGGWRSSYGHDDRDCDVRPYWGGAWGGRRW